jgi:hypothetical protein
MNEVTYESNRARPYASKKTLFIELFGAERESRAGASRATTAAAVARRRCWRLTRVYNSIAHVP